LAKSQTEDHRHQIKSIGIDLGKTTFYLIALGGRSRVVTPEQIPRESLGHYPRRTGPVGDDTHFGCGCGTS
jgi:hypothetical protein